MIERVITREGVAEYFTFADPLLGVESGDAYMDATYAKDRILDEIAAEQRAAFVVRSDEGAIIACGMSKIFTAGDKEDRRIHDEALMASLEYAAVAEAHRGKRIICELDSARAAWALAQDATVLVTEIELDNFPSLLVKFRDGFVATHILPPGLGIPHEFFILRKNLVTEEPAERFHLPYTDVRADRVEEVRALILTGSVVVGIKKPAGARSRNPRDWIYVIGR